MHDPTPAPFGDVTRHVGPPPFWPADALVNAQGIVTRFWVGRYTKWHY